jgi:chromosome segregation ATPase
MPNLNVPINQENSVEPQHIFKETNRTSSEINDIEKATFTMVTALDLASEFHAEVLTINATLTELDESIDGELEESLEVINNLREKVGKVEEQTVEATNQIKEQLVTIGEQVQTKLTGIQSETEQVQAGFDQLVQQVQVLSEEVGEQLEMAKGSLSEFQELIDSVESSLTERKTTLVSEFDTFEQQIREKLQCLIEGFTNLVSESTSRIEAVEQVLDSASGEAIAAISHKFVEEAVSELTTSAGDLNQAISGLGEIGEASKGLMEGEVGEVLDKVGEVTDLIERIKPVLDLVKEML